MSSRLCDSRPSLPTTHYFVSISRGDSIRTAALTPAALWALLALATLSLVFGLAGALELASGGRLGDAIVLQSAEAATRDRDDEAELLNCREHRSLVRVMMVIIIKRTTAE